MINKSAVDRGMFVTTVYKTISTIERIKSGNYYETIMKPKLEVRSKSFNYNKLDESGIISPGTPVKKGDVVVGKILTKINKENDEEEIIDCSLVVKNGEDGIIDNVIMTTSDDGFRLIKIKIRKMKIPEIGDKVCSNNGQKGTIGMVYRQEDMPFTEQGIVPDIIINPHSQPSRMTINQLLESILGKCCVLEGRFGDTTPFTEENTDPVEGYCKRLHKQGFERHGNETLYCGFTGRPIESSIFIGIVYYQRLKHMVSDKMHARSYGNVTMLSRQPLEGRSRDGGLRCGEMERDTLISHGVSTFLRERLFKMSDKFQINVCEKCGNIGSLPETCRYCVNDELVTVDIPYACKLLLHELNAMNIKTQIMPK